MEIIQTGDMKSYKQICDEIESMDKNHPAYSIKLDLISEYGEINYVYCCGIMGILNEWDYSYEKDCGLEPYEPPPLDEVRIRTLAGFIHERGGLQTLRMNYYTMFHFHAEDINTKMKVKQLQHIWDGVGEWRY